MFIPKGERLFPEPDRSILTEDCDFWQVRMHGRLTAHNSQQECFLTGFYQVVMEEPRNYSNLLAELRGVTAARGIPVSGDEAADEVCQMLWNESVQEMEPVSNIKRYIDAFRLALKRCPSSEKVTYF